MSHARHLRPLGSFAGDRVFHCHVIECQKAGMTGYMRIV